MTTIEDGLKWTLEAERMRRADLYSYLGDQGCRWDTPRDAWFHPQDSADPPDFLLGLRE